MIGFLPTKFFPPPLPEEFVARPHLRKVLGQALTHRLTLVSAPPGAGKTLLVSAWVQAARKKETAFGWLSLDSNDNDPGRFLTCLGACLEEGGTVIDIPSLPAGEKDHKLIENCLAELLQGLINLKREVVLILDDYPLIENKLLHGALQYFIDHLPAHIHLVLLTRSDPPLELARMRVAGQLVELRMGQLRFSVQEAQTFLEGATGLQLRETDVVILNTRAEGWIAGLQMAAISLRGLDDPSAFVSAFAGTHRYVFDYLIEQVLNRQAPEVQDFLLKTSVLERLSAPLCDAVTGTSGEARSMLDKIERANLFLVPLDDERGWYRYHHLFAELLTLVLEQSHPGLAVELHRRACRWYEVQGLLPEALSHALSAGDMELVAQIVSANVLVLIENNEIAPVIQKLESISQARLIALPWLGIARAWALGSAQVEKSLQILNTVEKNIEKEPEGKERRRLEGHIAAARASLYNLQGEKEKTIAQAKLANELLPPDDMAVRAMTLALLGDAYIDDRHHDLETVSILQQAMDLALQSGKPHVVMIAATALSSANLHMGKLRETHRVCLQALETAEDYQRRNLQPLSATGTVYAFLARVLAEWGELEQAIQYARKGLVLSERWGQIDAEVVCLLYLGRALMFANDWEQARRVFTRAQSTAQKLSDFYWKMSATFTLDSMLDSTSPGSQEIAAQLERVKEMGTHLLDGLLPARLLMREKRPDEALRRLDEELKVLEGTSSFDHAQIYALRALAYQAKGDTKSALVSLRTALELAEPEKRVMTLVRNGPPMEELLHQAKARSVAPEFVSRLLAVFESRRMYKAEPATTIEILLSPLSERELEVLQYLNSYLSTPEIAARLFVSTNTVRTHIKSIYGKLGVHGRSGAIQRANELGLLP